MTRRNFLAQAAAALAACVGPRRQVERITVRPSSARILNYLVTAPVPGLQDWSRANIVLEATEYRIIIWIFGMK